MDDEYRDSCAHAKACWKQGPRTRHSTTRAYGGVEAAKHQYDNPAAAIMAAAVAAPAADAAEVSDGGAAATATRSRRAVSGGGGGSGGAGVAEVVFRPVFVQTGRDPASSQIQFHVAVLLKEPGKRAVPAPPEVDAVLGRPAVRALMEPLEGLLDVANNELAGGARALRDMAAEAEVLAPLLGVPEGAALLRSYGGEGPAGLSAGLRRCGPHVEALVRANLRQASRFAGVAEAHRALAGLLAEGLQIDSVLRRAAGSNGSVWLELVGEHGSSERQELEAKDGARKEVEDFKVVCRDLGELRALRMGHDSWGEPWRMDMAVVRTASGGKYYFPHRGWLGQETPFVEIPASLTDPRTQRRVYKVVVTTSDLRAAGTDANVYCELRGERGATQRTVLRDEGANCFERGVFDDGALEADLFPSALIDPTDQTAATPPLTPAPPAGPPTGPDSMSPRSRTSMRRTGSAASSRMQPSPPGAAAAAAGGPRSTAGYSDMGLGGLSAMPAFTPRGSASGDDGESELDGPPGRFGLGRG
ncbi:Lipoxygenase y domain-containing protein 1 [Tetrabaena socialis]|uniref:Lipoxygenase y domain-containing protein 1 n=1 Tax=Tetrabaena socialis TaxID=47790 RepID=A0A2J8A9B1_9CHLO|nr:Lipoxygenase y domain-containing protein 1 [Tetrabaena socialis]|eukprot:PNH09091.1 Lipoxygenase y domain-containing protein 1 [Tetrabaena socialis]